MHVVVRTPVCVCVCVLGYICVNRCHAFRVYVFKCAHEGIHLSFCSSEDTRIQILITLQMSLTLVNLLVTSKDFYSFKSICVTFCLPQTFLLLFPPQPMQLRSCGIYPSFSIISYSNLPFWWMFQPKISLHTHKKKV